MRTTLTLDPDVALKLKRRMKERQISLKQAVNEALRLGLSVSTKVPRGTSCLRLQGRTE